VTTAALTRARGTGSVGDEPAPRTTVIIPARNEAGAIAAVVAAVPAELEAEVIVVDNASDDDTAACARAAGARVIFEPIPGYGQACRAGVDAARATGAIVFIDGDGSMDPRDIALLVAPVLAGTASIVCGSRSRLAEPASLPRHQRVGNFIAVVLLRLLYGVHLSELGPFRAVDATLLRELGIGGSRYAWVAELLARAARRGATISEVDVNYRARTSGRSKVSGTIRGSLGAGASLLSILVWRRVLPPRGAHVDRTARTRTAVGFAMGTAALIPIIVYGVVVAHRLGYHFELEWLEGGSVELVNRITHGHGIYTAPSLANVGWPYTPLYFYVAALVAKVIGVGFLPLRLVSFAASLGAGVALVAIVKRETSRLSAGLVAAGLFAAAYRESGDWYDLARVDSLFIALTLLALLAGRRAMTVRAGVVVGFLCFLAFFTKQSAAVAVAFALVALLVRRPKVGAAAIGVALAGVAASTLIMDALTGGWYRYYVFDELASQGRSRITLAVFLRDDLWHLSHPVVIVTIIALVVVLARRSGEDRFGLLYWAAAGLGLLASAWLGRAHAGGYVDTLIPAFAALALAGGLAWGWALNGCAPLTSSSTSRVVRRTAGVVSLVLPLGVVAALALQVANWSYTPSRQEPSTADARSGQAFLAAVKKIAGPVVILNHPWYATELNQGVAAQGLGIRDVLRGGSSRARTILEANLRREIAGASAVILDDPGDAVELGPVFAERFTRVQFSWPGESSFNEISDLDLRPNELFVRVPAVGGDR
jgi:glycosyltransferase involved in cell wall biosynthesis